MASRVVLKASDVAAIIGMNRYKSRTEIRDDLWKKYKPETFKGLTRRDKEQQALRASPVAQEVLARVSNITARDSSDVQSIMTSVNESIAHDANLTTEQKSEVLDHIRSRVYTSHGTRSEDKTSDKVEAEEGARLVRDNSFYNLDVCELGDFKFVIVGKIDRIEERPDGSRVLVEIKNRTNRLFKQVVEYEMVQVQVYLQMMGLTKARLVEQYNSQVLSHDITRDEEMWSNTIVPRLEEFCNELYECFNK